MPTHRRLGPDGVVDQHATCQHEAHRLTCEQFEELVARANGACEICGRTDERLFLDHDHAQTPVAYGGLRGLVCRGCNAAMHYFDAGRRPADDRIDRYLRTAKEWRDRMTPTTALPASPPTRRAQVRAPMPNQPKTPTYSIRIPPEVMDAARTRAAERGETVSDVVRRALARYARSAK